jgi:peptide/nickel transport system substrate-binding protein
MESRMRGRLSMTLMVIALFITSCTATPPGGSGSSAGPEISRAKITVRLEDDWRNQLNFTGLGGASDAGNQYSTAVFDRLVALSADGSKVIPYVASSWTASLTKIVFNIRKGVTCSDGTPLTPSAIKLSFEHLTDPKFRGPNDPRPIGDFLLGAGGFSFAADDAAGTFTFNSPPNNELLQAFSWPHVSIICPAGFAPGADFNKQSYGSGPFVLESLTADSINVKRRPDWNWGPDGATGNDPGRPDQITFLIVKNPTTAANQLLTGELDLGGIRGPDMLRLRGAPDMVESGANTAINGFMKINEAAGRPGNDKLVRQALMTAIDPKEWDQVWNQGQGVRSTSILSAAHPCFEPETAKLVPDPPGDLTKAKALLAQAGWTPGSDGKLQKNGQPLKLVVLTLATYGAAPEYIAEQFNKLGAQASVVLTSVPITDAGDFDVQLNPGFLRIPITGSLPAMFDGRFPPAGSNQTRVVDPVLADLLVKARAEEPGVCTSWKAWQRRLISEYHAVPMTSFRIRWFGKNIKPVLILGDYADARTFLRSK